jgi:hypothetical protein
VSIGQRDIEYALVSLKTGKVLDLLEGDATWCSNTG